MNLFLFLSSSERGIPCIIHSSSIVTIPLNISIVQEKFWVNSLFLPEGKHPLCKILSQDSIHNKTLLWTNLLHKYLWEFLKLLSAKIELVSNFTSIFLTKSKGSRRDHHFLDLGCCRIYKYSEWKASSKKFLLPFKGW